MSETERRIRQLVPFLHVEDLERSIRFYRLLGFEVEDTYHHQGELDWAGLRSREARLMLARASAPVDWRHQAVLFYLYLPDLDRLHAHLIANGVQPGEIVDGSPGPEREFRLSDPDCYCLMVAASGASK